MHSQCHALSASLETCWTYKLDSIISPEVSECLYVGSNADEVVASSASDELSGHCVYEMISHVLVRRSAETSESTYRRSS